MGNNLIFIPSFLYNSLVGLYLYTQCREPQDRRSSSGLLTLSDIVYEQYFSRFEHKDTRLKTYLEYLVGETIQVDAPAGNCCSLGLQWLNLIRGDAVVK